MTQRLTDDDVAAGAAGPPPHMHLAYLLLLSRATPADVSACVRLLRAIHHADNLVAIHLDAKAPEEEFVALKTAVEGDPRLGPMCFFLRRAPVSWAGISVIQTHLRSMTELLARGKEWLYWINLSGADYPLMSQDALRRVLSSLPAPMDFIPDDYWMPFPYKSDMYDNLFDDPAISDVLANAPARDAPSETTPTNRLDALTGKYRPVSHGGSSLTDGATQHHGLAKNGSAGCTGVRGKGTDTRVRHGQDHLLVQFCKTIPAYFVFSRDTCEYLLGDVDGRVRDALVHFSTVFAPDELIYGTLLANSGRARARIPRSLMFESWPSLDAAHPSMVTGEHWELIRGCVAPFARKFAPGDAVLDRIDRELLGNVSSNEWRAAAVIEAVNKVFIPPEALSFSMVPVRKAATARAALGYVLH
eukprot:jgi/Mesvir1/8005/Mv11640-RA.1